MNLLADDSQLEAIVGADVVPRFIQFLDSPELQLDACRVLSTIATQDPASVLGATPVLISLLTTALDLQVKADAICALGGIAAHSPEMRDTILHSQTNSAFDFVLSQISAEADLSSTKNAIWIVSNLCRGEPPPPFEVVRGSIPKLLMLIYHPDADVLADTCWTLSSLCRCTQGVQTVVACGFSRRMIELLV